MSRLAPVIVHTAVAVTANYGEMVVATAALTVRLPHPSIGLAPILVKSDTTGTVTIARSGTALIDGATSLVLTTRYSCRELVPDGTNWLVGSRAVG